MFAAGALAIFSHSVHALPGSPGMLQQNEAFQTGNIKDRCSTGACVKPSKQYERILNSQPGYQWNDAGGYCGSWSIQRAAMAKGAWISQQQVRNHTVAGGGHDNEILETNIDLALSNLKIKGEAFDYANLPTPQLDSGRKWMKNKLSAGHPLVQMIMLPSGHFPVYPGLPFGDYSHIEPIVGIMSDHPLTDEEFYDDDIIVHYNDNDDTTLYRNMSSLPGQFTWGVAQCPGGGDFPESEMCLHPQYVFSWAIMGFEGDRSQVQCSLNVDQYKFEPDLRQGASPVQLTGTITIEGLESGEQYALHRWDSIQGAFGYSDQSVIHRFTASGTHEVFEDPQTFSSDGTIYYSCVSDSFVI